MAVATADPTVPETTPSNAVSTRQTAGNSPGRRSSFNDRRTGSGKGQRDKPPQEVLKTWAFDSVGTRKYALQIRKASNGNPCIKFVEGVPQTDGTFRKFDLTIWSEDWPRLFETIDALRAYVAEQNIKTPVGHKYDPNKKPKWKKK